MDENYEYEKKEKELNEKLSFAVSLIRSKKYADAKMVLNDYSITPIMIIYNYIGKNDRYLSFTQLKDKSSYNVDTENAKQSTTYINNQEAMVVEKENRIIIIYDIDEYTFQFESRGIDKEELYKVAKSIIEVK